MSGVDLFLDNTSLQFYPGSIITGRAVCNFNSSKDVRKVRIRLMGDESTHWSERERYYDHLQKKRVYRSVSYNGYRDFLLRDLIVHGEGTMNSGEHVFPFEFQLPGNIPSTFHHSYGRIKYTVKVTVDLPIKIDYESEKEIFLISPITLQSISVSLLDPIELFNEKMIGCLCCTSGPIQLDVNLQKRVFTVGENAIIHVNCSNMSNSNVERIGAEIKMELTFKATRPVNSYKRDSELVAATYTSAVGSHGEDSRDISLEIPPSTLIPNFNGSELFGYDAQLKVTAALSGCHSNLDVITNIAMGYAPSPEPSFPAQYKTTAPFYPSNAISPMSMPMPMPGYEAQINKATGIPPYPVQGFSPGPSAPREIGAPSAPPKTGFDGNPGDLGVDTSSELPPPTYDEAAKK